MNSQVILHAGEPLPARLSAQRRSQLLTAYRPLLMAQLKTNTIASDTLLYRFASGPQIVSLLLTELKLAKARDSDLDFQIGIGNSSTDLRLWTNAHDIYGASWFLEQGHDAIRQKP
jgi:hypothetical protein